jgi:hypothetical protein
MTPDRFSPCGIGFQHVRSRTNVRLGMTAFSAASGLATNTIIGYCHRVRHQKFLKAPERRFDRIGAFQPAF